MAHTYNEFEVEAVNGVSVSIPATEILRIIASGVFRDGSAWEGMKIQGTTLSGDLPDTAAGDLAAISEALTDGCDVFRSIDLDESEEAVKATPGVLHGGIVINLAATVIYLKFYNATVANTTVGSTTPFMTIPIPAEASNLGNGFILPIPDKGITFSAAITVAATTGVADNDAGAPGANEVVINLWYK